MKKLNLLIKSFEPLRSNRKFRKTIQQIIDFTSAFIAIYITTLSLSIQILPILYIIFPVIHVLLNKSFGSYQQLWRYGSNREIQNLILNASVTSTFLISLKAITFDSISYEFIAYEAALFFLISFLFRSLKRIQYKLNQHTPPKKTINKNVRTLFIGAGKTTFNLINQIKTEQIPLNIIACLDDDKKKIGAELFNIPIIGKLNQIERFIKKFNIELTIIAIPKLPKAKIQHIVTKIRHTQSKVKIIPSIESLINTKQTNPQYNFKFEDLQDSKEFKEPKFLNQITSDQSITLVTGGAGYIGIHLIKKLLDDGQKVRVLENFSFGKSFLPTYFKHPNLEIIEGDIANIKTVVTCLKNVKTIIALAAIVGDPACSVKPDETLNLNYEATKVLIETANFYGINRLIFASSCSVYGASDTQHLTEESLLNPVSLYAKTRIMSEDIIFDRCGNVEPVILRLSTVFGLSSRMRFDLVVNLLTVKALIEKNFQIFGPSQWRPFIHCADVAEAFFLASKAPSSIVSNEIFNVGNTNQNYTLGDLGSLVKNLIPESNYTIKENNDDLRNYKVNFNKIESKLNFQTKYSLEKGILEIIEHIKQNPQLQNYKNTIFSNFERKKEEILV
ncbi:hypothetical protein DID74_00165 [Candidatus Marinamargulisbacteria bacterium SCGC AG-333-B06]|nr:hypothetical protein DID74_00165 [Candidatus Marinamargulisbacteria bacterium SCGC AG-333-B06]